MRATRGDVEAFWAFCQGLRASWQHYRALFGRDDVLSVVAEGFSRDLRLLMVEHLILQSCKLTDPEESRGQTNLTVDFLVDTGDFSAAPEDVVTLRQIRSRLNAFRAKILPARNKLIGHLDRDALRRGETLEAIPLADWEQFWVDLQDCLAILHRHYGDAARPFRWTAAPSDAAGLIAALKAAAPEA